MPAARPESVTMRDVARAAGVSVATVSRYYNGTGPVKAATRDRIEAVAQRLRYVPNTAARSLNTRQTHTIGVLLPDLYGEFFPELLRGFDRAARAHGLHLLVAGAHGDADELVHAARALHGRVDGLVVMSPEAAAGALEGRLPPGLPLVLLGGEGASLTVDNRGGAHAATQHLIGLGHRRIAHLRGTAGNEDAEEREVGYRAALEQAGLAEFATIYPGDFTEQAGRDAVEALLGHPDAERPTALFAANDGMAVGALSALRERGLTVPEDLSLVGFDDVPMATHLTPALTTVHVPTAELGTAAIERLRKRIGGQVEPPRTLPATLVVRASTAPAPNGHRASAGSHPADPPREQAHTPKRADKRVMALDPPPS